MAGLKKNLNNLKKETYYSREVLGRDLKSSVRGETAIQAIGDIKHGMEFFGFTKGQFSMIDVIIHILNQTGPADVSIITWSAADADIRAAHSFLENGNIRKCRFLVDYSFKSRKPEILAKIVDLFGDDAVRISSVHAKSVLIQNEDWNFFIRTSMNLNFNPRFENFEISEGFEFADWMRTVFDEIWNDRTAAECLSSNPGKDKAAFRKFQNESGTEKVEVKRSPYDIFKRSK